MVSAANLSALKCNDFRDLIPKLRNHDSCYPKLRGDDPIVNMSQIKQLDGGYKPAATPQAGRG
jgi:hypothetical protein